MLKKKLTILIAAFAVTVFAASCGANGADAANSDIESDSQVSADSTVEADETDTSDTESDTDAATGDTDAEAALADGTYIANFDTDGTMFHVNEVSDGKGVLTVANGEMTIHLIMPSKNVVNLYLGLAEDATKDGAELIEPTVEEVTYDDGLTEEVNAFDVPVPVIDEEFDLAIVGTKGTWYDHKVKVSDPEPTGEVSGDYVDGEYKAEVALSGGSGKAYVSSPATVVVEDGKYTATIKWSSPHYDYMIVDGERFEPVNTEGNSVFEIPISGFDTDIEVIADTVAMSEPHEIEYTLHFKAAD